MAFDSTPSQCTEEIDRAPPRSAAPSAAIRRWLSGRRGGRFAERLLDHPLDHRLGQRLVAQIAPEIFWRLATNFYIETVARRAQGML
jgi:hypothetical protein